MDPYIYYGPTLASASFLDILHYFTQVFTAGETWTTKSEYNNLYQLRSQGEDGIGGDQEGTAGYYPCGKCVCSGLFAFVWAMSFDLFLCCRSMIHYQKGGKSRLAHRSHIIIFDAQQSLHPHTPSSPSPPHIQTNQSIHQNPKRCAMEPTL